MHAIVLDLDHTLVHTLPTPDARAVARYHAFTIDNGTAFVHIRPHTDVLLQTLAYRTDVIVVVWTAGTPSYARDVVAGLYAHSGVLPALVLDRSHATYVEEWRAYVKELDVVSALLPWASHVTLVDDDVIHTYAPVNRGRVLYVPPFDCRNARDDDTLMYVLSTLVTPLQSKAMGCLISHRATPCFFYPPAEDNSCGRLSVSDC